MILKNLKQHKVGEQFIIWQSVLILDRAVSLGWDGYTERGIDFYKKLAAVTAVNGIIINGTSYSPNQIYHLMSVYHI